MTCLCIPGLLFAEELPARPAAPSLQPSFEVRTHLSHQFSGRLDGPASFSLQTQSVVLDYTFPADRPDRISASASVRRSAFDFQDASGLIPGLNEPFGTIWEKRASLSWMRGWNDLWSSFLQFGLRDAREEGASGSGLTGFGTASVQYQWNEKLSTGAGILARTRLERSPRVLPVPVILYRLNEQWLLRTRQGVLLSRTSADRQTSVTAGVEYRSSRFRIGGGSVVPAGVAQYKSIPVTLEIRHDLSRSFYVAAGVFAAFNPSIRVEDSKGRTVRKNIDSDPVYGIGFEAGMKF